MATILKCDTCDAVSPNKDGLHVGNFWAKVTVNRSRVIFSRSEVEYAICDECLRRGIKLTDKGVSHDNHTSP